MMVGQLVETPRKPYNQRGGAFHLSESPVEGTSTSASLSSTEHMGTPESDKRLSVHLRSNFSPGYIPPDVPSSRLPPNPPQISRRTVWPSESPHDEEESQEEPPRISTGIPSDEDMPDDEAMTAQTPSSISVAYAIKTYSSTAALAAYETVNADTPRTPPKSVTPPLEEEKFSAIANVSPSSNTTELESHTDDHETPYEEFGLSPGSSTEGQTRPRSILKQRPSAEDDDSLFDFADENGEKRKFKKGGFSFSIGGRRATRKEESEEDDTSLEQDYGMPRKRSNSSLQRRAQEAWASRHQRSHSNPSSRRSRGRSRRKEPTVSFGGKNTIHHFETVTAQDEDTVDTAGTNNSSYSKSVESEVEDLIKDLFCVGDASTTRPGRRKFKDRPESRRNQCTGKDDVTLDDTTQDDYTLNTLDDTIGEETSCTGFASKDTSFTGYTEETHSTLAGENLSLDQSAAETEDAESATQRRASSRNDEDDPLGTVWDYMEGGMNAVGEALGLSKSKKPTHTQALSKDEVSVQAEEVTKHGTNVLEAEPVEDENILQPSTTKDSEFAPFDEMINYASGLLFASATQPSDRKDEENSRDAEADDRRDDLIQLEDDDRLEELVMHAVRAKHTLQGSVFDESANVDVVTDIKFVVVKLALPLGILFHENEGGCWVSRIFDGGNAATNGEVLLGDQLASINGSSSISMRVDEICSMIADAPDPDEVELTLLRYTGPLYPLPQIQVLDATETEGPDDKKEKKPSEASTKASVFKKKAKKQDGTKPKAKNTKRFRIFGRRKKT